jgi:hypothetical protein
MLAEIGLPVVIGSPIVSFIQLITLEIIVFFFWSAFSVLLPCHIMRSMKVEGFVFSAQDLQCLEWDLENPRSSTNSC